MLPALWKVFFLQYGKGVMTQSKEANHGHDLDVFRRGPNSVRNFFIRNGDVIMNSKDVVRKHKIVNEAVCVVDNKQSTSYEITLPRQVIKITVEFVDKESDAKAPF